MPDNNARRPVRFELELDPSSAEEPEAPDHPGTYQPPAPLANYLPLNSKWTGAWTMSDDKVLETTATVTQRKDDEHLTMVLTSPRRSTTFTLERQVKRVAITAAHNKKGEEFKNISMNSELPSLRTDRWLHFSGVWDFIDAQSESHRGLTPRFDLKMTSPGDSPEASAPTKTTVASSNAPATPGHDADSTPSNAKRVNLIALFDRGPKDRMLRGWVKTGNVLIGDVNNSASAIIFPYAVPDEYDYTITFSSDDPRGDVLLNACQRGGDRFAFVLGGSIHHASGFQKVDGHWSYENDSTVQAKSFFVKGQRTTVTLKVRRDKVEAFQDGKLLSSVDLKAHKLDYPKVPMRGTPPDFKDFIGFAATDQTAHIYAAELVEITGSGKPLR